MDGEYKQELDAVREVGLPVLMLCPEGEASGSSEVLGKHQKVDTFDFAGLWRDRLAEDHRVDIVRRLDRIEARLDLIEAMLAKWEGGL